MGLKKIQPTILDVSERTRISVRLDGSKFFKLVVEQFYMDVQLLNSDMDNSGSTQQL